MTLPFKVIASYMNARRIPDEVINLGQVHVHRSSTLDPAQHILHTAIKSHRSEWHEIKQRLFESRERERPSERALGGHPPFWGSHSTFGARISHAIGIPSQPPQKHSKIPWPCGLCLRKVIASGKVSCHGCVLYALLVATWKQLPIPVLLCIGPHEAPEHFTIKFWIPLSHAAANHFSGCASEACDRCPELDWQPSWARVSARSPKDYQVCMIQAALPDVQCSLHIVLMPGIQNREMPCRLSQQFLTTAAMVRPHLAWTVGKNTLTSWLNLLFKASNL